jgi:hypothetical protein
LIWEQAHDAGNQVQIWTICAGDPPEVPLSPFAASLHHRWAVGRDAIAHRRQEDIASCGHLMASYRHFSIPDCIYRVVELRDHPPGSPALHYFHASEESLFSPLDPGEYSLVFDLAEEFQTLLPESFILVSPLALGGHVDHRLTRQAAEELGLELFYYADYPYVLKQDAWADQLLDHGWQRQLYPISSSALRAWGLSVAAHQSQISTFWSDLPAMQADLRKYLSDTGGIYLWTQP